MGGLEECGAGELQPPLGMLSGALEDKIKSCQLNVGFPQSHCSFWKARRSLPEKARRCEGAAREMLCAGLSGWEERALRSGQSASPVEFVTTGPGGVPCAFVFKPTQQAFSGPLCQARAGEFRGIKALPGAAGPALWELTAQEKGLCHRRRQTKLSPCA